MAKGSNPISKTAIWILMGLLILGLGGFGATNLSGTLRTLGTVGDKHVDIDQYARQLSQEIRAIEAESGQSLRFAQAQAMGLDRAVLQRLITARALDHETAQLGLSIGDAALRDQIMEIPAFRGVDGSFDRDGYTFSLEQSGLTEAQFETRLREEAARTLLQAAIGAGAVMPDSYAETLVAYVSEERDFTWARLDEADLEAPLVPASEDELRAYHKENQADFQRPETKEITYAYLSPDMLMDRIDIEEDALRAEYDARAAEYNQPERRLVERLPFLDDGTAEAAAARLAEDATLRFDDLVIERGLTLSDVDLGDVGTDNLGDAGAQVFAAAVGDVVGPLPSDLGPALFRVNGVLPAQNITFEDALPELRGALADDRARRMVDVEAQRFDDMLAGGATLEDLAAETDMTLETVSWFEQSTAEIAGYAAFRETARATTQDDFPIIVPLSDGGVFALRVDAVAEARDATFDEAREDVAASLERSRIEAALRAQAEAILPDLTTDAGFEAAGLRPTGETGQTRNGFIQGTPAAFLPTVFDMSPGETRVIDGTGAVYVVRLSAVRAGDTSDAAQAFKAQLAARANQSLSQNLLGIFSTDTTLRAGPQIDQRAVQAVHVNFP